MKKKKKYPQGRKDPNQAGFIAVSIRTVKYLQYLLNGMFGI